MWFNISLKLKSKWINFLVKKKFLWKFIVKTSLTLSKDLIRSIPQIDVNWVKVKKLNLIRLGIVCLYSVEMIYFRILQLMFLNSSVFKVYGLFLVGRKLFEKKNCTVNNKNI